jgi:predicted ATP-grasp superfamily ATP-dependent carboligase
MENKADVTTYGTPEVQILKNEKAVEKPYSIYTRSEKWFIVITTSVAGLFR